MGTILKDQSIVNAGCTPIQMVYWRIVDMDTSLDILTATGGAPGADITGLHASFIGGTYLEPDVNFAAFNGITTQVKFIKQIKDNCGHISPKLEMIFSVDITSGNFEIECDHGIAFAKEVQVYDAAYPDDSLISLANIPLSGSVSVFKNFSLILQEGVHFNVVGTDIEIITGSTDPTVSDTDVFIINYAYQT